MMLRNISSSILARTVSAYRRAHAHLATRCRQQHVVRQLALRRAEVDSLPHRQIGQEAPALDERAHGRHEYPAASLEGGEDEIA